jgi:hypothetical protein
MTSILAPAKTALRKVDGQWKAEEWDKELEFAVRGLVNKLISISIVTCLDVSWTHHLLIDSFLFTSNNKGCTTLVRLLTFWL